MLFETSCKFNCWECTTPCQMVQMFRLPEPIFNDFVLTNLKARAGFFIANNYNVGMVEQDLKEKAVSLKIARTKYLETLQ